MMVRFVYSREKNIDIPAAENKGNNIITVEGAYGIQLALRLYSSDSKIHPANSRVVVKRKIIKGERVVAEDIIADAVDSEFLIEVISMFPANYDIVIYESGVCADGVIRYV